MNSEILGIFQEEIQFILSSKRLSKKHKLLTLPNETLIQILRYLSAEDLFSCAYTCNRLRECALAVFQLKCAKFDVIELNRDELSVYEMKNFLRIFGDSLYSFKISRELFDGEYENFGMIKAIGDLCANNLIELSMKSFKFDTRAVFSLKPVLQNLHYLRLIRCEFDGKRTLDQILWTAMNLNELDITFTQEYLNVILPEIPSLRKISFGDVSTENYGCVETILEANPQINEFCWRYWYQNQEEKIFRIMKNLFSKTMTSLTLEHYERQLNLNWIESMSHFRCLENLIIKCGKYIDFLDGVSKLDLPIKYLQFTFYGTENLTKLYDIIILFRHLKHIKILHVQRNPNALYSLRSDLRFIDEIEIVYYENYPFRLQSFR